MTSAGNYKGACWLSMTSKLSCNNPMDHITMTSKRNINCPPDYTSMISERNTNYSMDYSMLKSERNFNCSVDYTMLISERNINNSMDYTTMISEWNNNNFMDHAIAISLPVISKNCCTDLRDQLQCRPRGLLNQLSDPDYKCAIQIPGSTHFYVKLQNTVFSRTNDGFMQTNSLSATKCESSSSVNVAKCGSQYSVNAAKCESASKSLNNSLSVIIKDDSVSMIHDKHYTNLQNNADEAKTVVEKFALSSYCTSGNLKRRQKCFHESNNCFTKLCKRNVLDCASNVSVDIKLNESSTNHNCDMHHCSYDMAKNQIVSMNSTNFPKRGLLQEKFSVMEPRIAYPCNLKAHINLEKHLIANDAVLDDSKENIDYTEVSLKRHKENSSLVHNENVCDICLLSGTTARNNDKNYDNNNDVSNDLNLLIVEKNRAGVDKVELSSAVNRETQECFTVPLTKTNFDSVTVVCQSFDMQYSSSSCVSWNRHRPAEIYSLFVDLCNIKQ